MKMNSLFRGFLAAALLSTPFMATSSKAATVITDFVLTVTEGKHPGTGGSAAGTKFNGTISYDDSAFEPGSARTIDGGSHDLKLSLPFFTLGGSNFGGLFEETDELVVGLFVAFDAMGKLLNLSFSYDIPNDFFFFTESGSGSYDFSTLVPIDENDEDEEQFDETQLFRAFSSGSDFEQVTIASGKFSITQTTPVAAVPLPATAPLLITALLGGLALTRRRAARS